MNGRDLIGYLMGLVLFIVLIPFLMWKAAGDVDPGAGRIVVFAVLSVIGIALSVWSIVYMKNVGKGNPMDAFNHEVATRTKSLMTEGPYRICRNPMLLGVFIYYIGVVILLASWKALLIFILYIAIMMVQVDREEKRLEADFGEDYIEYKRRTKKIIPFLW